MRFCLWAILFFLAACTTIYPTVPKLDTKQLIKDGGNDPLTTLDLVSAKNLTHGLRLKLQNSVDTRETTELTVADIVFYGSLLAVGGTFKDSIAARNTGGGMAALASIFAGHYKTPEQKQAFQLAVNRLVCVERALGPIRPEMREVYTSDPAAPSVETDYAAVPQRTGVALDVIENKLRADLAGITLGTLSTEQIAEIYKKWLDKKSEAEKKPTPTSSAIESRRPILQATFLGTFSCPSRVIDGQTGQTTEAAECGSRRKLNADVALLLTMSNIQLADEQRRFAIAVESFDTAVTACEVLTQ